MSGFFKKIPIEVYVLFFPSFLLLLFFSFFYSISIKDFSKGFLEVFSISIFSVPLFLLLLFLFLRFLLLVVFTVKKNNFNLPFLREIINKIRQNKKVLASLFYSSLFVFFYISSAFYLMSSSVSFLFQYVKKDRVAFISEKLMEIDHFLFGTYPSFWMQKFNGFFLFDWFVVSSYMCLSLVVLIVSLSLLPKKDLFRKFVLSFFIAFYISFPIWFIFPAISPQEMYRMNILEKTVPLEISNIVKQNQPSERLEKELQIMNDVWIDPSGKSLAASAFPSLHMAWGVLLVYFSFFLFPSLFFLFFLWFIGNTIGTFYTFQHYFIDIVPGFLIGITSIYIANFLIKFDSAYYKDNSNLFFLFSFLKKETEKIKSFLSFFYSFYLEEFVVFLKNTKNK